MLRDYKRETEDRVAWIKQVLAKAGCGAIVFGSSGGKDSVLVGILCKMACDNTLGIIMPCESARNFEEDTEDALLFARHFDIEHITVDLTAAKQEMAAALPMELNKQASTNINPRLRMATLYAVAATRGALVAGTSNRSETHMGYFTKWGDAGCDFNPIADLTVTETYEFLRYLDAPERFWTKAPSAGLFPGQTDEDEMGVTYAEIDKYLLMGEKGPNFDKIELSHKITAHKRSGVTKYHQDLRRGGL
ncbi:MAG: NAD(+) synthase [Defluviitaleaceae bacterium]|nr:NAD(+) synthase [Defluviitaleaceae bacterium]